MDNFIQDLRYALRMLRKSPGFTLIAVLTLGLGIGANTTIFSLVDAVLLRPLPVEKPEQLVAVLGTDERNSTAEVQFLGISDPNYQDLRDKSDMFTGMAAFTGNGVNFSGMGNPEQLNALLVSYNYFSVLGVHAAIGNVFDPELAKKPGGYPVVVLSYGLWQRRFGADRSIIGKTLTLNQQPFTVIGIAPSNFQGTFSLFTPDLWMPDAMFSTVFTGEFREFFTDRRTLMMNVFGRLKPGVTLDQAEAQLKSIAGELAREFPNDNRGRNVRLLPLAQSSVDPNQRSLFVQAGTMLMGVVGLVLLIACANLANLLLARGADRSRELAVRMSLGANRSRLVALMLSESVLLSLLGGAVGLAVAVGFRSALLAFRPPFLRPEDLNLTMDARVLLFTLGTAILTALVFGALPAWQALRFNLHETLKEGGGRSGSAGGRHGLRSLLIVAEMSLSIIALVGAGLFLSSLENTQRVDPGFETKNLIVMTFDLGAQNYSEPQGEQFHRRLMDRLGQMPAVRSAALATEVPLGGGFERTVFPEGSDPSERRNGVLTFVNQVSIGYFETAGIPVLRGRVFSETDRPGSAEVAVVNEAFARKFFPGQDAIGKRFRCFGETWVLEIVGIVRDTKVNSLGEDPNAIFYLPILQHYSPQVALLVRTTGDAAATLPTVRTAVQELDRQLPLVRVRTISQIMDGALWAARFAAGLLLVFALLALTLAAVGIYGVMSYTVEQRRQELGIRMALGAQKKDVYGLVLGQGLRLATAGVVIGLSVAYVVSRTISALLFGVGASDPVTFAGVPLLLIAVALVASYIPARRATRVDPLVALRHE